MKPGLIVLAAVAALATGCGSGKASVAVSSPASLGPSAKEAKARQFVTCVRQNGIPNVQDPTIDNQGNVQLSPPPGLDEKSAVVQHALQVCQQYLQGVLSERTQNPQARHDLMLKFATCMRAHGMPNFPDPQPSSGDLPVNKHQLAADPRWRSANDACSPILSGGSAK